MGIGIVVVGAGLAVYFVLRAKKRRESEGKQPKMFVDTTDDRSVDVYADDAPAPENEEDAPDADSDSDDEASAAGAEAPAGDPVRDDGSDPNEEEKE